MNKFIKYGYSETVPIQIQKKQFPLLKREYFIELSKSVNELQKIDSQKLNELTKVFYDNFYLKNQEIIKLFQEILDKDVQKASNTLRNLQILYEVLDKTNKGFLTGDIHPELINGCAKTMEKYIDKINNDQENFQIQVENIVNDLQKYVFRGTFKLPLYGIKHPQLETKRNLYERQLILEDESNQIAIDFFLKTYEDLQTFQMSHNLKFSKKYIIEWFPNFTKAIKQEQDSCVMGDSTKDRKFYGKYLSKISSEKISVLTLTELMKEIMKLTFGQTKSSKNQDELSTHYHIISKVLLQNIGKAINIQFLFENGEKELKLLEKQHIQALQDAINQEEQEKGQSELTRQRLYILQKTQIEKANLQSKLVKSKISSYNSDHSGIPLDVQLKLASFLLGLIIDTIKIKNHHGFIIPLLSQGYKRLKKDKTIAIINVNEDFVRNIILKAEKEDNLFLHLDRSLPMIYKPAPWYDHEIGGYYKRPTNLMRIHDSELQEKCLRYADLRQTFQILNVISETPWKINKKILKVMNDIWEEGGGAGEIPNKHYDMSQYVHTYQIKECKNHKQKLLLMQKIQKQRDEFSLRCDFGLKIEVANSFKDIERIYFPHNIDFRGRIYPIPPHLNHMGADIARGLLQFSEGKPIGEGGLRWLKIHLSNKMGQDKLSFEDRVKFVESNLELIFACAEDPLKNREWLQFEECWQSLAGMFELHSALTSNDPLKYVSNLHCHQDGSCNGLQHYAALGRDIDGAKQVNLMNSEKPGDLYSHVAAMVSNVVKNDAQDQSSKFYEIAKKLDGNIKRKVVKQTVMTSVYGVTFIGARQQIYKQLKDKEYMDEDENEAYTASYYLAKTTLEQISNLFRAAHYIKQWLITSAGLIANTQNPVSWITPLGLPVVQPYRTQSQFDFINTVTQKISIVSNPDNLPINKSKQRSAFPPNFIHSLDSTHLQYTAIEAHKESITFAAVHDSYWTHAASVDRLNEILKDQFIKLHSQPLLEELKASFERRFPTIKFPDIPERGELDLNHVKTSHYFFA